MIQIVLPSTSAPTLPRPAYVVSKSFAIPLYNKPWGVYCPIYDWRLAGLTGPAFAVLSQPLEDFLIRKKVGSLSADDRLRLYRISRYIPEVREKLDL
jgi:hypothetical protein